MELIMMDRNGWSKSLKVEKTLTRIGTAATNDIQLKSKGIAPVHLQIIYSTDLPSKCQLVNLAAEIIVQTDEGMYQLPRLSTIEIRNGDEIELGEYRIALKIPLGAEPLLRSTSDGGDVTTADLQVKHKILDAAMNMQEVAKTGFTPNENEPKSPVQPDQSQPELKSEVE